MLNTVKIKAPATVANLVCGFDVLGLCVDAPFDVMEIQLLDRRAVIVVSGDGFSVPIKPEDNTAGASLLALQDQLEGPIGFKVTIHKHIRPGSGLGSSAASSAGAVVGANYLLGNKFTKNEIAQFALHGEKVASGVKHADNIAPAIFGGITLVRSIFPLDIISIPAPDLFITIVHPQIEVRTKDSRTILQKEILLRQAVKQWGNVGGLVAGFMKNDHELIGRSLEDFIVEPVRSTLIPRFHEVKQQSKAAGALGGGISGSGPSIFMLSSTERTARVVEAVMKEVYGDSGIEFNTYVTNINQKGIEVIDAPIKQQASEIL